MGYLNNPVVVSELKRIADENEGVLSPENVVEAARPLDSPLHSKFEWDNSKAAENYRLWQARQLIRITVEYIGAEESNVPAHVFVSLTTDRKEDGGYRLVRAVLDDPDQRQQLMSDALADMQRFQQKYSQLKELAQVFDAMRRVKTANRRSRQQVVQAAV